MVAWKCESQSWMAAWKCQSQAEVGASRINISNKVILLK